MAWFRKRKIVLTGWSRWCQECLSELNILCWLTDCYGYQIVIRLVAEWLFIFVNKFTQDMIRGAIVSTIRAEIDPCHIRMWQYVHQLQSEVATLTSTLRQFAPEVVYLEALGRQTAMPALTNMGTPTTGVTQNGANLTHHSQHSLNNVSLPAASCSSSTSGNNSVNCAPASQQPPLPPP